MTFDEAEAHQWLEEHFWKNLYSIEEKFCWLPKINTTSGEKMWMCRAVKVASRCRVNIDPDLDSYLIRWYKPADFMLLRLKSNH